METRQDSKSHQAPVGNVSAVTAQVVRERTIDRQKELGQYLANHRESMTMTLDQIARTTKIPKTSLSLLEAGRFDALPGDVFVRGFLRSYARCVHLDGDDVVRRYAQCGLVPAPVSGELADNFLAGKRRSFAAGTQAIDPAAPTPQAKSGTGNQATDAASSEPAESAGTDKGEGKGEAVRNVLRDAFDLSKQHIAKRVAESQAKAAKAKADTDASRAAAAARAAEAAPEERTRTFIPPSYNFDEDMSRRGPLTLGVIILVIVATLTMSYLLRRPGTSTDGFTRNDAPAEVQTQVAQIEASSHAGSWATSLAHPTP